MPFTLHTWGVVGAHTSCGVANDAGGGAEPEHVAWEP